VHPARARRSERRPAGVRYGRHDQHRGPGGALILLHGGPARDPRRLGVWRGARAAESDSLLSRSRRPSVSSLIWVALSK
jgi:hypothetical protein